MIEMDAEKWWLVCWIVGVLGAFWCSYALARHYYGGKDKDDPRPDGCDKEW